MGPTQRLSDETVLLAEFNHRLCNTLQIIAAMMALCRRDPDRSAKPVVAAKAKPTAAAAESPVSEFSSSFR